MAGDGSHGPMHQFEIAPLMEFQQMRDSRHQELLSTLSTELFSLLRQLEERLERLNRDYELRSTTSRLLERTSQLQKAELET